MHKFAALMSHRFCTLTASSSKVSYSISSIELDLHSTVNKKKKEYIYTFLITLPIVEKPFTSVHVHNNGGERAK